MKIAYNDILIVKLNSNGIILHYYYNAIKVKSRDLTIPKDKDNWEKTSGIVESDGYYDKIKTKLYKHRSSATK